MIMLVMYTLLSKGIVFNSSLEPFLLALPWIVSIINSKRQTLNHGKESSQILLNEDWVDRNKLDENKRMDVVEYLIRGKNISRNEKNIFS